MMQMLKILFGSHLYGLNTPESDMDYKGLFLPSREDVILNRVPKNIKENTGNDQSKNTAGDVDFEAFSLYEFVRLAIKGETVALDMLHADNLDLWVGGKLTLAAETFYLLCQNRTKFYSKDMKAYLGYVRRQAAKYGVKGGRLAAANHVLETIQKHKYDLGADRLRDIRDHLPNGEFCEWIEDTDPKGVKRNFYQVCGRKLHDAVYIIEAINVVQKIVDSYGDRAKLAEKNEGVDWKALSHALRAGYQLRSIYKEGDFSYPLDETDYLREVKAGKVDFGMVQKELEDLVSECEWLCEVSNLPDKPNQEYWDYFVHDCINEFVIR